MCRRSELKYVFQEGTSHIFPDRFQAYRDHIPEDERGGLIQAYYKRLTSSNQEVRRAAAREWTAWELGCCNLIPDQSYIDKVTTEIFCNKLNFTVYKLTKWNKY